MDLLVNIDVSDPKGAARFYEAALGLSVGRTFGGAAIEMVGASSRIFLLKKRPGIAGTGAVHLDFVVEDIKAACARAAAAGAKAEQPIQQTAFGRVALFADPFGHGFNLLQFEGEGYDAVADKRT